jgi:molybdopterin-guanine dinucleotide biosynthesis protein A
VTAAAVARTAGAVLCGGASSRMGRDKALIEVDGVSMVERVSRALEAGGCRPVVIVGGDRARLSAVSAREVVPDTWPGEGPLGGVIDAVRRFGAGGADGVVVAACDLPDLTADSVTAIAAAGGAAVAVADRLHPGVARWPIAAVGRLEALFEAGVRSLQEALDALGAVPIAVEPAALRNVNRPGDLGD